ncbi:MAG TPA: replication-relaxation family protein [Solirubrobacterales bacterium]|nr:replication-relaxation family protein [Solirubrobacterales bacterium]
MSLALPLATSELLASLAQHRVLSTPQVRSIHFPDRSPRWTRMSLAPLAKAGLAAFVPNVGVAGAPRRLWFVTERGARAALDAGLLDTMPRVLDAEAAAGALQAHTLAVNDAAICFVQSARERGDECGPLAWRHEVVHRLGYGRRAGSLFADAVLTYVRLTEAEVVVEQRFLELDRATLSVDRLVAELARYGRLLRATGKGGEALWRLYYPDFPQVICVLAGAEGVALRRRRDTVIAILREDPDFCASPDLSIRLCLADDLAAHGPFAPIFIDVREPDEQVSWLLTEGEER